MGLARSRLPFEQDASPRVTTEVLAERLVGQEDLQRARHFLEQDVDPADISEAETDLFGTEPDVGRSSVGER
jgi:hypothetical protein